MKRTALYLLALGLATGAAIAATPPPSAPSAQGKPLPGKPAITPAPESKKLTLDEWWKSEMSNMKDTKDIFYSGKVVVQNRPDDKLFELAAVKAAIYGARGYGTVFYEGSAWSVGEARDVSKQKVVFEELVPPTDGQPGKARFSQGSALREVNVEEAASTTIHLLSSRGWLIGDGSMVAVPVTGGKVGGRAWVTINGFRCPARITQMDAAWVYLTVARDVSIDQPAVSVPQADETVTIVTTQGKSVPVPYSVLTTKSADVPQAFVGAVVVSADGSLVGFIGDKEGFVAATTTGKGKFEPSARRVECEIEM